MVLDEPTAALDAETEHALFEHYAPAARAVDDVATGLITILVSHRVSTVQMALMSLAGPYAQLYNVEAATYR